MNRHFWWFSTQGDGHLSFPIKMSSVFHLPWQKYVSGCKIYRDLDRAAQLVKTFAQWVTIEFVNWERKIGHGPSINKIPFRAFRLFSAMDWNRGGEGAGNRILALFNNNDIIRVDDVTVTALSGQKSGQIRKDAQRLQYGVLFVPCTTLRNSGKYSQRTFYSTHSLFSIF